MEVDAQGRPTVRHQCKFYQKTGSGFGSSGGSGKSYSSYQQQQQQGQQNTNKPQANTVWKPKTWMCKNECGIELFYNNDDVNPRTGKGTVYEVEARIPHKCPNWSGNSNAPTTPTNKGYGGGDDPAPFGMAVNKRRDAGAVMEEEAVNQGWG